MLFKHLPVIEAFLEPSSRNSPPPTVVDAKTCRKDTQRRLKILTAANEAVPGERIAVDFLLKRCRNCGDCWMARL